MQVLSGWRLVFRVQGLRFARNDVGVGLQSSKDPKAGSKVFLGDSTFGVAPYARLELRNPPTGYTDKSSEKWKVILLRSQLQPLTFRVKSDTQNARRGFTLWPQWQCNDVRNFSYREERDINVSHRFLLQPFRFLLAWKTIDFHKVLRRCAV